MYFFDVCIICCYENQSLTFGMLNINIIRQQSYFVQISKRDLDEMRKRTFRHVHPTKIQISLRILGV